uniref:Regulation of nuclear pre-mRNA domain containing 1B n=1 Tax=Acanthochromis polyacanthus TaxID=80966 RepID=A0A3Q1F2N8_9TELE
MSSFSESALEKKLSELSSSQQSVQTLSLWIIHHRKHSGLIVKVWHRELKKAKSTRKLTFLYLANDVIQNSKKKGPEFTKDFESVLVDACSHVASEADENCKKHMERLLNIWKERSLYRSDFIQQLKLAIEDSSSPRPSEEKKAVKRSYQKIQEDEDDDDDDYRSHISPHNADSSTEELVKALQDLENAASGDAAVRQKIASLPQEVQDVSLLEKITGRDHCLYFLPFLFHKFYLFPLFVNECNIYLILVLFCPLQEYKQKLARVTQVRKELKSHIQSLPDLSLLPNVTGGLAPLPSAGDLFSTD